MTEIAIFKWISYSADKFDWSMFILSYPGNVYTLGPTAMYTNVIVPLIYADRVNICELGSHVECDYWENSAELWGQYMQHFE